MFRIMYKTRSMKRSMSAVTLDKSFVRLVEAHFDTREAAEVAAIEWFRDPISVSWGTEYYIEEVAANES